MTIRKGEQWGEAVPVPSGLDLAADDAAARTLVLSGRRVFGVQGGDLARTMGGGSPDRFRDGSIVVRAPVDLVRVVADDEATVAVAHVVARRSWWRGPVLLVMNAQFRGAHDVAPRAHPGDGVVDVVEVAAGMPLRARVQARRRACNGTHLPHPQLTVTRAAVHRAAFSRPLDIWVDGVRWRRATALTVTVEPDALTVHA